MQNSLDELPHALFVPDLYRWIKERSSSPLEFHSSGHRHIIVGKTDSSLDVYIQSNVPLTVNPERRHYGLLENHYLERSLIVIRLSSGFPALVSVFVTPSLYKTTSTFAYEIMELMYGVAFVEEIPTTAFRYHHGEVSSINVGYDDIAHLFGNRHRIAIISPYGEARKITFHRGSNKGVRKDNTSLPLIVSKISSNKALNRQPNIEIQRVARFWRGYTPEEVNLVAKMVSRHITNKAVIGVKDVYVNGEFHGRL